MILGYDEWKTTPPDEPGPLTECNCCGHHLYPLDEVFIYDGEIYCSTDCLIAGLKNNMELTIRELEEEEKY